MSAPDSLTSALCTKCGLCCDGSLLADVELTGEAEADQMESLELEVEDGEDQGRDAWFLRLPCRALCGVKCSIYQHRPETCRTFECRLLRDVDEGVVGMREATLVIAEARAERREVLSILESLEEDRDSADLPLKERVSETVLRLEEDGSPGAGTDDLLAGMRRLEALLDKRFLGE